MNSIVMIYLILILADIAVIGVVLVLTFLAIDNSEIIKSFFQKVKGKFFN